MMDYPQTAEWLEGLANPERSGLTPRAGRKMNLDATRRLMELLDNPHERIRAIHVAGTKGKGSVAAMLESISRAAGYRTGLFTSPHLFSWRERIRIDGRCISEERVAELGTIVRPLVEQVEAEGLRRPSFFEACTAMGMLAFAEEGLDVVVLETGLGGRLDSTNVVTPMLSIITTLGLDHTRILGSTVEEIAMQKAGIIKEGVPVVVAPQPPTVEALLQRTAAGHDAPMILAEPFTVDDVQPLSPEDVAEGEVPVIAERMHGDFGAIPVDVRVPLPGLHQAVNVGVAAAAMQVLWLTGELPVVPEAFCSGLERVQWPARVELLEVLPWLVVDCAHNQESARALMRAVSRHLQFERLILVLGASKDKPVEALARELDSAAVALLTRANLPRALPAEKIAERAGDVWPSHEVIPRPADALARAREIAGPRDLICVTGSVFVIGDLMEEGLLHSRMCEL